MGDDEVITRADLFGRDLFGEVVAQETEVILKGRFIMPPFSTLSARDGEWQERKRAWLALGLKGEETTRDGVLGLNSAAAAMMRYNGGKAEGTALHESASIFDPVVCELAYTWWCPEGGQIVDPFAGGSVRGIVAGALGRPYWGGELRPEQVAANLAQAEKIKTDPRPVWVNGDSQETLRIAPEADFIFSCPPYGDLEQYSDDPRDLSAMEWPVFLTAYGTIIHRAVQALKPNRFACFVVGDFRDKGGYYRNFVGETCRCFIQAGARLYNEAILLTVVGTAALRATKQFEAGRKLVKSHQNILVFCKGDWRAAMAAIVDGKKI